MRILLDTSVFLWCVAGEVSKLSAHAASAVKDETNELLLSAASLWEIALKVRAGKLELPEDWEFFHQHMSALDIRSVLPVEARHVFRLFRLPDHHRDPFDRLLVAQCQTEGLTLVTPDRMLRRYGVEFGRQAVQEGSRPFLRKSSLSRMASAISFMGLRRWRLWRCSVR